MAIKKHGKTDFLSGIRPESLDSIANEIETKKETAKEVVPEENNNSNNLSSNSPITDNKEKENEIEKQRQFDLRQAKKKEKHRELGTS